MSIAPDAFGIVREIVPNAAAALFLTSHDGVPEGFFHEDSPDAVRSLFLNEPQLFIGPNEYNVHRLVSTGGARKIGQLRTPPEWFYSSNTYQLLVRPSGHHHVLDGVLEAGARKCGVFTLYREHGAGFDAQEEEELARMVIYFEHALQTGGQPLEDGAGMVEREAMILASVDGRLLFFSPEAQVLLNELPLAGPHWPDRRKLPLFCRKLIDSLRDDERHPLQMPSLSISLPGGALHAHAQWMGAASAAETQGASENGVVGILLKRTMPQPLRIWRNLCHAALSPQQMEVAFWMALGGGRDAVRSRMHISEAVLRDCVKAAYETLGCASQAELTALLRAAPVPRLRPGSIIRPAGK